MGEVAEVASRCIYSQSSAGSAEAGSIVDVVRKQQASRGSANVANRGHMTG
jgi:hypothetical protein